MNLDLQTVRIVSTVLVFVSFLAIVAWTFSKQRKATYAEMAHLPLHDDPHEERLK